MKINAKCKFPYTKFYFASLHEYTIPHSITSFQYRWYPRLHTILYTACAHSSTLFQYSRYPTLKAWLSTHSDQDWPGTWAQQVLIAVYHSNTVGSQDWPVIWRQQVHRTGEIIGRPRVLRTWHVPKHTRLSGLDKYMNTESAQDWTSMWVHRVLRTGQLLGDTECTGLAKYMNTQSTQDWPEITRHWVHRTGKK